VKESYVILEGGGGGGLASPAAYDSQISARDLVKEANTVMASFMLEPGEGVSERLLNDIIKHVASYMRTYTTVHRV